MLGAVARHEVDVVLVWSLHHLGTSIDGLLERFMALSFILCPMLS